MAQKIHRIDLHGLMRHEALKQVQQLLFSDWRSQDDQLLEIVTGKGVIRDDVVALLDKHAFRWAYHPLSNTGCVRVFE